MSFHQTELFEHLVVKKCWIAYAVIDFVIASYGFTRFDVNRNTECRVLQPSWSAASRSEWRDLKMGSSDGLVFLGSYYSPTYSFV